MKKLIGMMLIAVNCTCNANADWLLLVSVVADRKLTRYLGIEVDDALESSEQTEI